MDGNENISYVRIVAQKKMKPLQSARLPYMWTVSLADVHHLSLLRDLGNAPEICSSSG